MLIDKPGGSGLALHLIVWDLSESAAVACALTASPSQVDSVFGAVTVTLFPTVQVNLAVSVAPVPSVAVTVTGNVPALAGVARDEPRVRVDGERRPLRARWPSR